MKNKTVKGMILANVIALVFACNTKTDVPPVVAVDTVQIKKEIQAKEDELAATYNAGVIKDIGYYGDDAISFFQNRPALVGKEAIVEFLKEDMSRSSNKISFKTNEVFVSNNGDQVLEMGYFIVVDSTNTGINKGNYMSLFEKRNGKYVCIRDMSASDIVLTDQ